MNVYGQLKKAQLENVSGDLSNAITGLAWLDTTAKVVKFYDGSAIMSVLNASTTQTMSNKTFSDAVTFAEIASPATPSAGYGKIYVKSDKKPYIKDSDGNEKEIQTVAGGGAPSVVAKTADYSVSTAEADAGNYIFTNAGATADIKFTLPAAAVNRAVSFVVVENYKVTIEVTSGDLINTQETLSMTGVYSSKAGQSIKLVSLDSTTWQAVYVEDNWYDANATALFGGGGSYSITIDSLNISTLGNSSSFGSLTQGRNRLGAVSSSSRGVFGGGYIASGGTRQNTIDYITYASGGSGTDFGDLTQARYTAANAGNTTRGLFVGGETAAIQVNTVDYITIASTGNATDFGDLLEAAAGGGSFSSPTRTVIGGGTNSSNVLTNTIQYCTTATTGNFSDFGDISVTRGSVGGLSNSTRGLFFGGTTGSNSNVIDYVTIASTGNAADFGDLLGAYTWLAGASNSTRGIIAGDPTYSIQYVTIATAGNAVDFGDLSAVRSEMAGTSNSHGGLQ